jgi:glycosyltransferase involved in cell wall biosynthesis
MRDKLPRWWVPDDRVSVLHNAVVAGRFVNMSRPTAGRGNSAAADTRVLNVGRLSVEKGQSLLLRAVAELAPSYPTLRVDFAGIGPLADELMREAQVLGIANRIKFNGYVEDMRSLYQCADLVVQSSLTEGLPNVMLEAGFAGVPVVATDVGGTREVIEHGVTGWLIQPGSVGALVEGIGCYLADPHHFREMTIAARIKVEREFSFDARTAEQVRIYESISGIGS